MGLDCLSTRKDNRIYLHVLKWHTERLRLPGIPRQIVSSKLLTGGTATVRQTEEQIEIDVPAEQRQQLDTIIELELDGPAAELKPVPVPVASLTFGKKVTASSVYPEPVGRPTVRSLRSTATRTAVGHSPRTLKSAWLEVDLGQPHTFNKAEIHERYDRVRAFRIQAKQGDHWVTVHEGTRIGEDFSITFPAVTAQFVRLEVLDTTINPLIAEFHVFAE